MTERSLPRRVCFVTGLPLAVEQAASGWPRLPLVEALGAIRDGTLDRVQVAEARLGAVELVLENDASAQHRTVVALAELCGHAVTTSLPADNDPGDLQPARAVRRALADGRMSAGEVGYIAVDAVGPRARERAAHAVARGLGRYAAQVVVEIAEVAVSRAAAKCVAAIANGTAAGAVALTMDPNGVNVALAFRRPR